MKINEIKCQGKIWKKNKIRKGKKERYEEWELELNKKLSEFRRGGTKLKGKKMIEEEKLK
jgi:hypothetical protein